LSDYDHGKGENTINTVKIPRALTLAGSDASGGAGLEADLKTFQEFCVYGMTAVTVIVAQTPGEWAHEVFPVELSVIAKQLDTILAGIGVDAMKTGMLGTNEIIEVGAHYVKKYAVKNLVVDPVMVCKGADDVMNPDTVRYLSKTLLPLAKVATPNLYETGFLSGLGAITTLEQLKEAAKRVHALGPEVVVAKGGAKLEHPLAVDVFYDGKEVIVLEGERIDTSWTHGAGCSYSAAIAAGIAVGESIRDAVFNAKEFIAGAIKASFPLNKFAGPLDHAARRRAPTAGGSGK
jgi:pyridoxine kinase